MKIKISKLKTNKKTSKATWNKKVPKYHEDNFMLANHSWEWSLPWREGSTQWDFTEENWFALGQGGSVADSFFFRALSPCLLLLLRSGTPSGLNLCRSRAFWHSLCEFKCASDIMCLEDILSSESFVTSGSQHLSLSCSIHSPEPSGEGVNKRTLLRTECFKVVCSLDTVQLWVSVLISSCGKKLPWHDSSLL